MRIVFGAMAFCLTLGASSAFAQYDATWTLSRYQIFLQRTQQQQSVPAPQTYSNPPNLPALDLSDNEGEFRTRRLKRPIHPQ